MTINDLTPQERQLLFLIRLSDALAAQEQAPIHSENTADTEGEGAAK